MQSYSNTSVQKVILRSSIVWIVQYVASWRSVIDVIAVWFLFLHKFQKK